MKRVIIILTVLLILFPVFADGQVSTTQIRSQEVGGFVEDIVDLSIGDFIIPEPGGINLDYTDESSPYRYNIMPSSTRLSSTGLLIGYFSVYMTFENTTYQSARLTITHDTMHMNQNGVQDELDYELAVMYLVYDGTGDSQSQKAFCLANASQDESFPLSTNSHEKSIQIDLAPYSGQGAAKICIIPEAKVYFRLASAFESISEGSYNSTVSFTLESL